MKRSRIAVVAVCVICVLGVEPPVRAASLVARQGPQQPGIQLILSGLVLREDSRTRVPNQRLRLRNMDTGEIAGEAVSGKDGAFSFPVGKPGNYVIEALASGGGVIAVSNPISSAVSPFTRDVILRTPKPAPFLFHCKGCRRISRRGRRRDRCLLDHQGWRRRFRPKPWRTHATDPACQRRAVAPGWRDYPSRAAGYGRPIQREARRGQCPPCSIPNPAATSRASGATPARLRSRGSRSRLPVSL